MLPTENHSRPREGMAEDVAAARVPDVDELRIWYASNSKLFAMPGRISFRQIYFSPDRRGAQARDADEAALTELAGQPIDLPLVASVGDSILRLAPEILRGVVLIFGAVS